MRGLGWILVMMVTGVGSFASAQEARMACQVAGSDQGVVQGRLGLLEGLGPAAFIVTVQVPLCLQGDEAADNVPSAPTVQLYAVSADGFQELYRLVGEKVYVRGKLSGLKTYQQKAPLLMEVIEIATQ